MSTEGTPPLGPLAPPIPLKVEIPDESPSSSRSNSPRNSQDSSRSRPQSSHPLNQFLPGTPRNRYSRVSRSATPRTRDGSVLHSPISNPISYRTASDADSSPEFSAVGNNFLIQGQGFPALAPIISAGAPMQGLKLTHQPSTPDSGMSSRSPSPPPRVSLRGRITPAKPKPSGWKTFGAVMLGLVVIPALLVGVAALALYLAAPVAFGIVVAAVVAAPLWFAVGAGAWTLGSGAFATWEGVKAHRRLAEPPANPQRAESFDSQRAYAGGFVDVRQSE